MVEQAAAAASWQGEALVDGRDQVWLPYDLPWLASASERWRPLSARRSARHAGRAPFRWPASDIGSTHVLNGMGAALGDAVIGGNALAWTRLRYPARTMHLYRSPHAPAFVERLYALALRARIVHSVHYLPQWHSGRRRRRAMRDSRGRRWQGRGRSTRGQDYSSAS